MVAIEYVEGCTGKQAYESQGQAAQAGRKIGKRSKSKLHAYRCKHCHLWHITSLDPAQHRRYREHREHTDPCDLRTPPSKVLDVSDHHLEIEVHELKRRVTALESMVATVLATVERYEAMALNLSDLIVALNDNTNAVSARLDHLVAELAAAGTAPTTAQLDALQAISDHLKTLGADPALPVPAPPPAAVVDLTGSSSTPAPASTPPADASSTPAAQGSTSTDATPPASTDGSASTPIA